MPITPTPFNRFFVRYLHDTGGVPVPMTLDHRDQIFSHSDGTTIRHFHITKLQKMIEKNSGLYERRTCAITKKDALFVQKNHGIEIDHLKRMPIANVHVPGIMIDMPDDTQLIVDGNHRYVLRYMMRLPDMDFWVLTERQARPCFLDLPPELGELLTR